MQELLVIFIVALLVVGPKKLPQVARQAGRILGQLRRMLLEARMELDRELQAEGPDHGPPEEAKAADGPIEGAAAPKCTEKGGAEESFSRHSGSSPECKEGGPKDANG